jgi:hypothetical protein
MSAMLGPKSENEQESAAGGSGLASEKGNLAIANQLSIKGEVSRCFCSVGKLKGISISFHTTRSQH